MATNNGLEKYKDILELLHPDRLNEIIRAEKEWFGWSDTPTLERMDEAIRTRGASRKADFILSHEPVHGSGGLIEFLHSQRVRPR